MEKWQHENFGLDQHILCILRVQGWIPAIRFVMAARNCARRSALNYVSRLQLADRMVYAKPTAADCVA
jgi:hypothetical protein